MVLYARAERFLEESHIDDIWGCCIQDVLECINGKKLIFFIDALEFIADCAETKFELLEEILKRNFLLRKIKKVLQILL